MAIQIHQLEEFGLSRKMGFLPETKPLVRLTKQYYEPWENIMDRYNDYFFSGRFREVIDNLPVLSVDFLESSAEKQRCHLILCFMAHSYIWADQKPSEKLPPSIAKPWEQISIILEMMPIISYASVCLWNWRYIFEGESMSLSNLATIHTFSGTRDESWFYLISTIIEFEGAPCLQIILDTIAAAYSNNKNTYIANMRKLSYYIGELTRILCRMYEKCDPYIFYWKNMADEGLPKGVFYEGCSEGYRLYSGGSNAQSALIHTLDIALGIAHYPVNVSPDSINMFDIYKKENFFKEMRMYMPGSHRRFLEYLEKITNIRQYSLDHSDDSEITAEYNACIANLKIFRDKHLQIVSRYIIIESKTKLSANDKNYKNPTQMNLAQYVPEEKNLKGTGGTNLVSFLKQTRNGTHH
ncbi:hypothetical protein PCANB_000130 [Pneumocystis canis]|nr:hypothetical protein PCANB_000130 [Pneumocystis canis]